MAFEVVGLHRATVIIKQREENKEISARHMWYHKKLLNDSKVSLDIPPAFLKKLRQCWTLQMEDMSFHFRAQM